MRSRFFITVFVLVVLLGCLVSACETGFETQRRGSGDDDSTADDDDSGNGDDDDSGPSGDDDTGPSGDDDTGPSGDDDTSPSGDDDTSTSGDDDTSTSGDDDTSTGGNSEGNNPAECSDGIDNDSDGQVDCEDPDCCAFTECDPGAPGSIAPVIPGITYQWIPGIPRFSFQIEITDQDCDLTPLTLHWSVNQQARTPLPPNGACSANCSLTYNFHWEQPQNAAPGLSYAMLFSIEDSSGNRSADYELNAEIPP